MWEKRKYIANYCYIHSPIIFFNDRDDVDSFFNIQPLYKLHSINNHADFFTDNRYKSIGNIIAL